MSQLSSTLISHLTQTMDEISLINNHSEIHHIIQDLLMHFSDSDYATLLLYKPEEEILYTKDENPISISVKNPIGLIGHSFLTKTPLLTNHPISHKEFVESVDALDSRKLQAQILFPLLDDDKLIGMIYVSRSRRYTHAYTKNEVHLLSSLKTFLIKIVHILTSDEKVTLEIDNTLIKSPKLTANMIEDKTTLTSQQELINFSNIIHDIRNPANGLYGFLKLMEEHTEDKQLKMFIQNAKESAKLINTLTNSILEESKQTYTINVDNVSIINSIQYFTQISNLFSANMYDKKIKYIISIDSNLPKEIEIDELKLNRVITNLIGNAYKFTPPQKHIYFNVSYNKKKNAIDVFIKDEGIGIDEDRQEKIFDAFTQAENDTNAKFGGTGLGLSISSQFIKDLGGKLILSSILDEGSTFSFSIPIKITNTAKSHDNFVNLNKNINILTDKLKDRDAANIKKYLINSGMPKENIVITDTLKNPTHLFCFQHKLTPEILRQAQNKNFTLLIIEEDLFSLASNIIYNSLEIASLNTYYGDKVHHATFSASPTKILIADNNKINVKLLEAILATEYVEITTTLDGEEALRHITKSYRKEIPFDIIFLANDLPIISGKELINICKDYSSRLPKAPYMISTTCLYNMSDTDKEHYDALLKKPFSKDDVRNTIKI